MGAVRFFFFEAEDVLNMQEIRCPKTPSVLQASVCHYKVECYNQSTDIKENVLQCNLLYAFIRKIIIFFFFSLLCLS